MKNVYLVCCIGVSNSEWFSFTYFRMFLEHYLGLGIWPANFRFTLHSAELDGNFEICREWLSDYGIHSITQFAGEYDCFEFYERNFAAIAELPRDAWIILVDFDELIFFPDALPRFVKSLEKEGFNLVMGNLIDRLAPGGILPRFRHDSPIWDQFPINSRITRDVVRGDDRKTCIFRRHLTPSLGHHFVREEASAKKYPSLLPVFHFKWDESIPAKLAKRVVAFDQNRTKYPWIGELYKLLERIDGNRIIMK